MEYKEGDHAHLFEAVKAHEENETMGGLVQHDQQKNITRVFRFVNGLELNKSHPDIKVNFLEYVELVAGRVRYRFTWITDQDLTEHHCIAIMRVGRARWKVENETFNTLKNQEYRLEHNYGHGQEHLSTNFALLMMLAFLVDQLQRTRLYTISTGAPTVSLTDLVVGPHARTVCRLFYRQLGHFFTGISGGNSSDSAARQCRVI